MFDQNELSWLRIASKRNLLIGPSFPMDQEYLYDPCESSSASVQQYSPSLYSLISSGYIEVELIQVISKNSRSFGQTEYQWAGILTPKAKIIMMMIESENK